MQLNARNARNNVMLAMAQSGHSLKEIGDMAEVTKERVRQILKESGVTTKEFRPEKVPKPIKPTGPDKVAGKAANAYALAAGISTVPSKAFDNSRNLATRMGIAFDLTFVQWWALWADKFHLRGRKKGQLVMGRIGHKGGYSVGNVEIIESTQSGHNRKFYGVVRKQGGVHVPSKLNLSGYEADLRAAWIAKGY